MDDGYRTLFFHPLRYMREAGLSTLWICISSFALLANLVSLALSCAFIATSL
jgi:hypothetical protein